MPFSFTFTFSPAFADSTSSSLIVMLTTSALREFGISSTEFPTIYASRARAPPTSNVYFVYSRKQCPSRVRPARPSRWRAAA